MAQQKHPTILIAALILLGIAGVIGGFIAKDYATAEGHDVWVWVIAASAVALVGGFIWLVKIQPGRKNP